MTFTLPKYFFRYRKNGAIVFRIGSDNRQQRIDMEPIAKINLRKNTVEPQGGRTLVDADHMAIRTWIAQQTDPSSPPQAGSVQATLEHLNLTAQWAQSQASDEALEAATPELLLAMHDLRTVLVRKQAKRLDTSET